MAGLKPGCDRDFQNEFPVEPPVSPSREAPWPLPPPAFPHPHDPQAFVASPAVSYAPFMAHSPDGNALAAAHAYFRMQHSSSPAALASYMQALPDLNGRRPALLPHQQWGSYGRPTAPYPEEWPYGKTFTRYSTLRPPYEGQPPLLSNGYTRDSSEGLESSDYALHWSSRARPPSACRSDDPSTAWQQNSERGGVLTPGQRSETPGRRAGAPTVGATTSGSPECCPVCWEPRPRKVKEGGQRCNTIIPVRDAEGNVVYDKDGAATGAQCPHIFMPLLSSHSSDPERASTSGRKHSLQNPSALAPRVSKSMRTSESFFRSTPTPSLAPSYLNDVETDTAKPASPAVQKSGTPAACKMPSPLAAEVPTVLPVTICPECKYEYHQEMGGQVCSGRVPKRTAAGHITFDSKGIPVMQPCSHIFAEKEECKLRSRIEMLSPELRGMLVKGKPRDLAQVEDEFWKGVSKIEKELPSMGGADIFIAMISLVNATETQNSECLRFASCTLSDGSEMKLVLLRYCTGQYSKLVYGRPQFDAETDRRLNATLEQLAMAQERILQKKTKRAKKNYVKNLQMFLESIGLSHCHENLMAKEFDLETLLMGSGTGDDNPGLMTAEFLAEETSIPLKAAKKIMEKAGKMRRKQENRVAKTSKTMAGFVVGRPRGR